MLFEAHCDPAGIRTQDPYIKSVMLYQLSYEIINQSLKFALASHFSEIEDAKVTEYEKFTNLVFKISNYDRILFQLPVCFGSISKN